MSSTVRRAKEKFAIPKVRRTRSPAVSLLAAGSELDFYPPHQRTNIDNVEVGQRAPEISHKAAEKPRPVLPFERNLLVVDDDRRHVRIYESTN
jgi:hypothetical protein